MTRPYKHIASHAASEDGSILVFWSMTLVVLLGLAAVVVDAGRLATTQSELQSYADSVSLAAAAELDGRFDAIVRAQAAASNLIHDSQTFGDGSLALGAADLTLTFYRSGATDEFDAAPEMITTDPHMARFVRAGVAERSVSLPFSAAMSAMGNAAQVDDTVGASAVASFGVEACNVTPIAVCLPSVEFSAAAAIGTSLSLDTSVAASVMLPGNMVAYDAITGLLDGLEICAGLSGGQLDACLLAGQKPPTECGGPGGFEISADVDSTGLLDAVNTRFGQFNGLVADLAGDPDFPVAPSLLGGVLSATGLCLPQGGTADAARLPLDDCFASGACTVAGHGSWSVGRAAYVDAHYDGTDPFPDAQTRFEFYQAEVAAGVGPAPILPGEGLLGGVTGGLLPQLCVPPTSADATRRLMVVAGINCAEASVGATLPPVREFFEVFALGPGQDGVLNVEITACLGNGCGTGNLGTEVRDIVRLVE